MDPNWPREIVSPEYITHIVTSDREAIEQLKVTTNMLCQPGIRLAEPPQKFAQQSLFARTNALRDGGGDERAMRANLVEADLTSRLARATIVTNGLGFAFYL